MTSPSNLDNQHTPCFNGGMQTNPNADPQTPQSAYSWSEVRAMSTDDLVSRLQAWQLSSSPRRDYTIAVIVAELDVRDKAGPVHDL